jgi:hypothetical protein
MLGINMCLNISMSAEVAKLPLGMAINQKSEVNDLLKSKAF